jgi:hypothetical protein
MSNAKLAALRAQFGGSEKESTTRESFTSNYYPFWNMKAGQRAIIRFLPDANSGNPRGFLVEKVFHNLNINGQKRTVPCLSMYGEDCPVCKISQDYYKVKDEVNGKKYWRKKQYIAQALVVEDPLDADKETGENHAGKVRYIALGYQLYNIIKEAFASEDDPLDDVPYSFEGGYDFIIKKTQQGEYSTYTMGTKFQSRQRSLTEDELVVVTDENGGMIDLATLLPKNPGLEKVQGMLNADLNGEDYQESGRGGQRSSDDDEAPAPRSKPAPKAKADDDDAPWNEAPKAAAPKPAAKPVAESDEGSSDVDDMLAAIRARRKAG